MKLDIAKKDLFQFRDIIYKRFLWLCSHGDYGMYPVRDEADYCKKMIRKLNPMFKKAYGHPCRSDEMLEKMEKLWYQKIVEWGKRFEKQR